MSWIYTGHILCPWSFKRFRIYMLGLGFSSWTSVVVSVLFASCWLNRLWDFEWPLDIRKVTLFNFGAIIFIAIYLCKSEIC